MDEIRQFKTRIYKASIIIAGIIWLVSLIFLRINFQFIYGLALGTCISIVNMQIAVFSSDLALKRLRPALVSMSTVLRLVIYGYVFYVAVKMSMEAAAGCFLGFMTQKIAIVYIYGIKTKYSTDRKVSPEVQEEYERMDREKEEQD